MAKFLDRYVHAPMQAMMEDAPNSPPPLTMRIDSGDVSIDVGGESYRISRG